jgi:hypothetical protein
MLALAGFLVGLAPLTASALTLAPGLTLAPPHTLIVPTTPRPVATFGPIPGDVSDFVDIVGQIEENRVKATAAIDARAATLSWLGAPKGDISVSGIGIYYREYVGGNLYSPSNSNAAFAITGDTLKLYLSYDKSEQIRLGWPKGDTIPCNDQRGWRTEFTKGAIYWTPQTGAQKIIGEHFKKWDSMGRETSYLGYPVTGEMAAAGGDVQSITAFEYGQITSKGGVSTPIGYGSLVLDRFRGLGGIQSPLGLPFDARMPIQRNANGAFVSFRGGVVNVPYNAPIANPVAQTRVVVRFAGLECKARQEGEDEMYGGVAAFVPSLLKTTGYYPIADWRFKDGVRLWPDGRVLYEGPPADVVLTTTLLERDDGPKDWVFRWINSVTQSTANAVAEAGGIPVLEDVVKAFTREVSGLVYKFGGFLEKQVGAILRAIFGSEDDKYPAGLLAMKADSLRARAANKKTLQRFDAPGVIEYTDQLTVTAVDNGNDRGIYTFYFKVEVYDVNDNL